MVCKSSTAHVRLHFEHLHVGITRAALKRKPFEHSSRVKLIETGVAARMLRPQARKRGL